MIMVKILIRFYIVTNRLIIYSNFSVLVPLIELFEGKDVRGSEGYKNNIPKPNKGRVYNISVEYINIIYLAVKGQPFLNHAVRYYPCDLPKHHTCYKQAAFITIKWQSSKIILNMKKRTGSYPFFSLRAFPALYFL